MVFKRKQRNYYVMSLSPVFTENGPYIYIYIYIKNQQSPISPHNFVYFIRFYRFHCSNRFSRRRQVVNIATMRNDVTSGVTSGVSNVAFINNDKGRY